MLNRETVSDHMMATLWYPSLCFCIPYLSLPMHSLSAPHPSTKEPIKSQVSMANTVNPLHMRAQVVNSFFF